MLGGHRSSLYCSANDRLAFGDSGHLAPAVYRGDGRIVRGPHNPAGHPFGGELRGQGDGDELRHSVPAANGDAGQRGGDHFDRPSILSSPPPKHTLSLEFYRGGTGTYRRYAVGISVLVPRFRPITLIIRDLHHIAARSNLPAIVVVFALRRILKGFAVPNREFEIGRQSRSGIRLDGQVLGARHDSLQTYSGLISFFVHIGRSNCFLFLGFVHLPRGLLGLGLFLLGSALALQRLFLGLVRRRVDGIEALVLLDGRLRGVLVRGVGVVREHGHVQEREHQEHRQQD